ncbi:ABC transporter permease subunit [Glutamicibacter endophyticus]|uniref:ABC transporter permease subunit n=1 Tax=Glutamicibacter endophyticus TaxID=1522174 RepID=UPI003AF171FD
MKSLIGWGSRVLAFSATLAIAGLLPWFSSVSAERAILRARYADREATDEALAAIRAELGLDRGPWHIMVDWFAGVLHGDLGTSWVSHTPVAEGIFAALAVSLTLMGLALLVALCCCIGLCLPVLRRGLNGKVRAGSGAAATALTALPEFVLAMLLMLIFAIWLGWFPPFGWESLHNAVLPALALGIPAGGLMGKLLSDSLAATLAERWVATWQRAGYRPLSVALAALRRATAPLVGQLALVVIGLTGGAVAVEQTFAIPGLGRLMLGAASAQDVPALQASLLVLLLLAALLGTAAALVRWLILGPAVRAGNVPISALAGASTRRDLLLPGGCLALLAVIVLCALPRDPFASAHPRLAAPSLLLPFGADASGRDLLARVGHGALLTLALALLVVAICLVLGIVLGSFPRLSIGPLEVANAAPPIIAGLLVATIFGPSVPGAVIAVSAVGWAPLAAHTSALLHEFSAQAHIRMLPLLGLNRAQIYFRHLLPQLLGPLLKHALLRLPGLALTLASLGYLGLGPKPPTAELGLILAEGLNYLERAPWAVAAPAGVLVLLSILAVTAGALRLPRRVRTNPRGRTLDAVGPRG